MDPQPIALVSGDDVDVGMGDDLPGNSLVVDEDVEPFCSKGRAQAKNQR